jgi:hypothetical protein
LGFKGDGRRGKFWKEVDRGGEGKERKTIGVIWELN